MYMERRKSRYVCHLIRKQSTHLLGTEIAEEDMLGYFKKIDLEYDKEKTKK